MRYIVILSFCMLLAKYGKAQGFSVSGKVTDESSKPVAFASIFIFKQNSPHNTPIAGKITGEDGSFKLAIDSVGTYIIKATYTSYHDFTKEIQVKASINLETIVLREKDNQLNVVTVTAQVPVITKKIDRIVMNVQNNALAAGKSSLELMNLAPGVFVNDGKISINGNPGTRVMVNGKLLQLTGQDLTNYLSNLRAEDIQSVEVIAHPSAEYDAEGSGGLINIILKKNRKSGFNGSVNTSFIQGKYAGTSDGVSLNYNNNKLTLFGSYSYNKSEDYENSSFLRSTDGAQLSTTYNKINHYQGNLVRVGGTYDIDKNQYVGAEYNGSFRNTNSSLNSIADVVYPMEEDNQRLAGEFPVKGNSKYNNLSLNYHLRINGKGSELVILSDYTQNKITPISEAYNTIYDFKNDFVSDTSYGNRRPGNSRIFTADIHYKNVLSKIASLTFGAKISSTNIDNQASNYFVENGITQEAASQDFEYIYQEKIYAGYLNFNTSVLNTDIQIGLRGEHTDLVGTLTQENNDQRNPADYFNLFPSVFLKKNLNKSASDYLTFNFSRRVQRPPFSSLNPYQFYIDNYTVARGNPYLVPSFINSFELAYTLKNKYTASVFLDKQKDMIGEYLMTNSDTLLSIDIPKNFGNRTNYGLTFNVPIEIEKWWQMQNNITIRHESLSIQGYTIITSPLELQTTQEFSLPGNFTLSANAFYYSRETSGNIVLKNIAEIDLGLQKKLFQNKLTAKISANDLFKLRDINATVYYNGGTMLFKSDRQWQTVNLSLVYNFDLGKTFQTHKIENSNAEEKNRL